MKENPRFWNRVAGKYAARRISDEATYTRKLEMTRACLPPDARLFEFGCGTGATALAHAPHVAHVRAIDYAAAMIDIARERQAAAGVENVSFEVCSAAAFDPGEARYDAVLALNFLHLSPDAASVVAKAAGMLRPGGVLVTSTFCAQDRLRWFRPVAPVGRALGLLPSLSFFTFDALKGWMRDAGLEIETELRPENLAPDFAIARKPG